jgi:carboxyl-terminal processing protease
LRDQRSISLNLEKRRAERTQLEANRLARENARRTARSEPPLASIEDLDASKQPDVVLDQSAEVMVDMLKLSAPTKSTKPKTVTAKREAA